MAAEFLILIAISGILTLLVGAQMISRSGNGLAVLIAAAIIIRLCANVLNQKLGLFEPAPAGASSAIVYEAVQNGGALRLTDTFLVQTLLSWPFLAVETSRLGVILSNNVWSMLLTFWALSLLQPLLKKKSFFWLLAGSLLFPAVLNFNLVGLRDPLIFGFVLLYAAASLRFFLRPSIGFASICIVAVLAIVSLRIELAGILLVFTALQSTQFISKLRLTRGTSAASIMGQKLLTFSILGCLVVVIAGVTLRTGASAIGFEDAAISEQVINSYVESRFERQYGQGGGGSSIYSGQSFQSLPLPIRSAVSFVAMFVVPFPWHVTSLPRLYAFLESLLIVFLVVWCVTGVRRRKAMSKSSRDLLIAYFVGAFVIGIFMVNFGNAFRMRLAILPFLLISAAFIYDRLGNLRRNHTRSEVSR